MSQVGEDKVNLGQDDFDILSTVERVCSVFSLFGCIFIIVTFCFSKAFHKPINRLVFYASFGNGITNIGTLMARSYIGAPGSPGCQIQAFLIQMFMPADAFWTLAMAVNVYLTFYYHFDGARLRRMEIPYIVACYGIPFVPALSFLFVTNKAGVKVYGNATLWCWVSREWGIWRIITFYGPVWVAILITFFIYLRTGGDIYRKRKQLHDFSGSGGVDGTLVSNPFASMKTTEVHITSESIEQPQGAIIMGPIDRRDSRSSSAPRVTNGAYSCTITAQTNGATSTGDNILPIQSNPPGTSAGAMTSAPTARQTSHAANNAAWSYAKCALLFFTALLITWIPSSANRVYSVVHENHSLRPLEYMSAAVLPLQGFWNALIYMVTSWKACKSFWYDVRHFRRPQVTELVGYRHHDTFNVTKKRSGGSGSGKSYETESMTELANSRPGSGDHQRM
ncbi:G-protein coupled receptor [Plectosphaerella plurivora]|uniref:G-protein coupled receptor n=1 Tax=Plectosphaerella plurivora TaxID=936078 RepID=A0A9P8V3B1_9PEZI|nr:G-protein coupled receptor [Plectosphaerella plurivora]